MPNRHDPLPDGFTYAPEVMAVDEEAALIAAIGALTLDPVVMRGFVAKRRAAHFGVVYRYDSARGMPGPEIPLFLSALLQKVAPAVGLEASSFSEALVTEYPPGAVIGWHRDAPMFGPVVLGISLASGCRMRFRRERPGAGSAPERAAIELAPRSAYVLQGPARAQWQHSIPAVAALRYSVTFRSVRPTAATNAR